MNQLLSLHRQLCISRFFQEKLLELGLNAYTEFGEEAISVGAALAMDDGIISCYFRGEGSALRLKGAISLKDQMAWFLGRKNDGDFLSATLPSGWTDTTHGVIGVTSSLIGADADVAVGAAFAQKKQKTGKAVLFMSGDGATSKGNFHEMMNFSSVFALPLVILVRGNGWAMSTNIERDIHVTSIPDMVRPFGIRITEIDGNNILAVMDAVKESKAYAVSHGPAMIYAKTYRMSPHSAHDKDEYRDPAVRKQWIKKDPITVLEGRMEETGISQSEIDENKLAAHREIEDAYTYAMEQSSFTPEELLERETAAIDKIYGRCGQ